MEVGGTVPALREEFPAEDLPGQGGDRDNVLVVQAELPQQEELLYYGEVRRMLRSGGSEGDDCAAELDHEATGQKAQAQVEE